MKFPKEGVALLPHDGLRPYTKVEALVSLLVDRDNGKKIGVREYSRIWGWPYQNTRRFIVDQKWIKSGPPNSNKINSLDTTDEPKVDQKRTTTNKTKTKTYMCNSNKERDMSDFESFWKAYPARSKGSKKQAAEAFRKSDCSLEEMIEAIGKRKNSEEKTTAYGGFIPEWPHAVRWLKNKRWEDEYENGRETDNNQYVDPIWEELRSEANRNRVR